MYIANENESLSAAKKAELRGENEANQQTVRNGNNTTTVGMCHKYKQ
jgi:hypothetical protein